MLKQFKTRKQLSKSSLLLLVLLAACKPKVPDVDFCGLIFDSDLSRYFGYCLSWREASGREYEVSFEDLFSDGYVCLSPAHYGDLSAYLSDLSEKNIKVQKLPELHELRTVR